MDELQQQIKNQHLEIREQYPVHELHYTWYHTEPSYKLNELGRKVYALGGREYTKLIEFAAEVQLRNLDVDYWMSIKPQRAEGETDEELKVRSQFQKVLLKYRSSIYNYSNLTPKTLKRARKQSRKTTTGIEA